MLSLSFKIIIITCCEILNVHVTCVLSSHIREQSCVSFFLFPSFSLFFIRQVLAFFSITDKMLMMTTKIQTINIQLICLLIDTLSKKTSRIRAKMNNLKKNTSFSVHQKRRYHLPSILHQNICTQKQVIEKNDLLYFFPSDYCIHTVIRQLTCRT